MTGGDTILRRIGRGLYYLCHLCAGNLHHSISKLNACAIISVLIFTVTFSAMSLNCTAVADAPEMGAYVNIAPTNPDYVRYVEGKSSGMVLKAGKDMRLTGFVPPIVDLGYLKGTDAGNLQSSGPHAGLLSDQPLPDSYDLRKEGKVSGIRDQGQVGSCWSFATMASLESGLMPAEVHDFSENNMKNTHGFDYSPDDGGQQFMSIAYLSRWSGPVDESDDPYSETSAISLGGLTVQKHVQEVFIIPDRLNALDNDNIKRAIMDHGAVFTSMHFSFPCYESGFSSHYYGGSEPSNHAVTIVGWDDNYGAANFTVTPPGNGAFIIKNSWGESWGDEGYFYVSYYDTKIGSSNAVFIASSPYNYDHIYQHDPLGWVSNIGLAGNDTAIYASIYTSDGQQVLSAASFYAIQVSTSYHISVYLDPSSGPINPAGPVSTVSGTIGTPGYYTVPFSQGILLEDGQKFSIVVSVTTPGYLYPAAIEKPDLGYSSNATAERGEGFFLINGVWSDLIDIIPDASACLKAFTLDPVSIGPSIINGSEGGPVHEYTIKLKHRPQSDVTVTMCHDTNVSTAPCSITFTPDNWGTPQNVTVNIVDDGYAETDHISNITHSVTSADGFFNALYLPDVSVLISDNDEISGTVTLSAASYNVSESEGNLTVSVYR